MATTREKYLSRQEAATLLRVDLATVDRLIATAALPRYRLAGLYVRVRAGDVHRLMDIPRAWLERC